MSLHNQSLFRWNIRDINVLINKMEEKAFATGLIATWTRFTDNNMTWKITIKALIEKWNDFVIRT